MFLWEINFVDLPTHAKHKIKCPTKNLTHDFTVCKKTDERESP